MNATQTKQLHAAILDEIHRSTWQFHDQRAAYPKHIADRVPCVFITRRPSDAVGSGDIVPDQIRDYRFRGDEFELAQFTYEKLCADRFIEIITESDVNAELERRKKIRIDP